MITAICVKPVEKREGIAAVLNIFAKSSIRAELRQAANVRLMYITYRTANGKVRIDKLRRIAGVQKRGILCGEETDPARLGFKRFEDSTFGARLCTNMAYGVLKTCPASEKLRMGICDPNGEISDFMLSALEYCPNVTVVTDDYETYRCRLNMALEDMGASASITGCRSDLAECDFVIAADLGERPLPVRSDAVILAASKPRVNQSGLVYYKYDFRIPEIYAKIKPDELDAEYFCSALYAAEGVHSLGTIMPRLCIGDCGAQTVKSIAAHLSKGKE